MKDSIQTSPPPSWSTGAVIYQVNTRQFTPEGTFKAFAKHLSRLQKLGVKILWFMPIHPIGQIDRKGKLGSYYAISDYYEINPEFGNKTDFKKLVQQIHNLGMKVMLDLVVNHTAWDSNMLSAHPEWYKHNKKGDILPGHPEWTDTAKLDYDQPELCRYITDMMKYWITEFDIDGYRCDVAHFVPDFFWREAIADIQKIKPVLMLAESDLPWLHRCGFHMTYSTKLYWLFNAIAKGKRSVSAIVPMLKREKAEYPTGSMRMRFTSNHDENSWVDPAVTRLGTKAAKAFAVLCFTLHGTPLIYNGQEVGSKRKLKFFEKDEIPWQESPFTDFYQKLVQVYGETPALHAGEISYKSHGPILLFTRKFQQETALVAINLSPEKHMTSIRTRGIKGEYTEIFSNKPVLIEGKTFDVELKPWEYRIFV